MAQSQNIRFKNINDFNKKLFLFTAINVGADIYAIYPDVCINDTEKYISNAIFVVVVDTEGVIIQILNSPIEWQNIDNLEDDQQDYTDMINILLSANIPNTSNTVGDLLQLSLLKYKDKAIEIAEKEGFRQ
jgi:hypothetical protein